MAEEGRLRPTHKPSASASSYLLITRRPSSASLSPTPPRRSQTLKRPYPLLVLCIIDLALTLRFAHATQRVISIIRFVVTGALVGCSKGWRARHGAVLFMSLGSLVSVLWEACQGVMAEICDWKSPALLTTTCFSILEYLVFILAIRLSPIVNHSHRYETQSIPTPRTPSRHDQEQGSASEDENDDDVSSISSSEIVDLPPPLSPARLRLEVDPVRLVRRRSARFFGGGSEEDHSDDGESDFAEEEDRLGRSLSRSWRRRSALEAEGYGTFR